MKHSADTQDHKPMTPTNRIEELEAARKPTWQEHLVATIKRCALAASLDGAVEFSPTDEPPLRGILKELAAAGLLSGDRNAAVPAQQPSGDVVEQIKSSPYIQNLVADNTETLWRIINNPRHDEEWKKKSLTGLQNLLITRFSQSFVDLLAAQPSAPADGDARRGWIEHLRIQIQAGRNLVRISEKNELGVGIGLAHELLALLKSPSPSPSAGERGWRTIDTHDGTRNPVLVSLKYPNGVMGVGEAHYDEADKSWWWANEDSHDYHARQIFPTHWMPLPAAPDTDMGER